MNRWRMLREEVGWWWKERRYLRGCRSNWWNLYDRILCRFHWVRLPRRGRVVRVRLRGAEGLFHVRLGSSDFRVLKQMFVQQEYRPVLDHLAPPVRTIVDLGANAGFSIRFWHRAFPQARVVAVEPDAANMAICRLNAGVDVAIVQCCVAGRSRMVALDRGEGEWAYRMIERSSDADAPDPPGAAKPPDAIAARTLDDILASQQIEGPIDLLKCDIEGAELELFAGCSSWVGRVKAMVVETHPPYSVPSLLSDLARAGWQAGKPMLLAQGKYEVVFIRRADEPAA